MCLTGTFMLVEAGVGWWSQSLALLADAGHMLSDSVALAVALLAQAIARRQRTHANTYGFRRAEVLSAFGNGIALGLTALWILAEAYERFLHPLSPKSGAMLGTAAVGLAVNIASAFILGHGEHGRNLNTRAALMHVVSDAVGSVGALAAGALVGWFGWILADAVVAALVALLILWSGWRLLRETTQVLMEGSPSTVSVGDVEQTIRSVPGVADVHDLHVWSISDAFEVVTAHVVLARGFHGTDVCAAVCQALRRTHGLDHATIQPEPARAPSLVPLGRPSGRT